MIPDIPPTVEGRIPTETEMEAKARNGRYYLENVCVIVREFPSADNYECPTDLGGLVNKLKSDVQLIGYELEDASDRFNALKHALPLTLAWAELVREARTTKKMFLVRRTAENCGPILMLQRQEHLRGQCTEMAPLAYIAIVRDDQLVVTRDRVSEQDTTERILLKLAKNKDDCAICMEFLRSRQSTSFMCGHCVHSDCFRKFVAAGHDKCPLCREPVDTEQFDIEVKQGSALQEIQKREPQTLVEAIEIAEDAEDTHRRHVHNMPAPLFNQQMRAVRDLMEALGVEAETHVEEVVLK